MTIRPRPPIASTDRATVHAMEPPLNDYPVICRQWARAQRHAERAQREWQLTNQRLEAQVVRLRGRLLALRTAVLWGVRDADPAGDRGAAQAAPSIWLCR